MIEITDGTRTLKVPEATASATLTEKWLKRWRIVAPAGNVPGEVVQFQEAKRKEATEPKDEDELYKLPLSRLEEIAETLSQSQLEYLLQDQRKSVKALAKRHLNKLRNDSGK